ncbi:MAG: anti-sigma factor antagonist [Zetaproteobacteria bacterium]|nr:MAG: anti-sigma factor antagonist [Zetaproteobacteria bacterium]
MLVIEREDGETRTLIKAKGALTMHTATRLLRAADAAMKRNLPLELDLAEVDRMDTAGAATLVEILARAKKRGFSLCVRALSDAARKRLAIVRVLDLFSPCASQT